jgi:hypothetical protein
MNDADLELLLHRILSGYLIFYYKQEKYELRKISNSIRYEADLLYNNIISDEKYGDWIREEYAENVLINLGLWTNETSKNITQIEKRIDNFKVELFENFMNPTSQKKIRSNLNSTRNQLNKIKSIKTDFLANTLEGYASSIKHEFLICHSLYKNSKRIFDWHSKDQNSVSLSSFNSLVSEINKYIISISEFKSLSRSYIWKSYWNMNKNTSIFPGAVSDWTDDQRSLVSFSQMYDSIYEHPDCPSEKIIEDDDMLDGWMIVQKRKVEKAKKQASVDDLNPNLKKAGEVFLFGTKPEDVEEILALNSRESLNRMKEKISAINSSSGIEDSALPDNRRQIISEAQSMLNNRK